MIISFSPVRMDVVLQVSRAGDVLTVDSFGYRIAEGLAETSHTLDFGPLPEGARLPREAVDCPWLASDVTREGGVIRLALILPHGPIPFPPPTEADVVLYPAPITLTGDGPVALPTYTAPEDEE